MHLTALLLALGSSLGWAGLDTCRKVLARRLHPMALVAFLTLGQLPLFTIWLVVDGRFTILPGYGWPASISMALNTVANVLFIRAVQRSPLSLTVPLLSLTPVFTALMGLLILSEVPTLQQTCGILLVVAGAFGLPADEQDDGERLRRTWRAFTFKRDSLLMIGVALLWSITAPLDKLATARSTVALHALVLNGGIALGLLLMLAATRRLHDLRAAKGQLGLLLGAITCGTAALGLQLMAFQWLLVALVSVIKRVVGLVAAVVLGYLVFAEVLTLQKLRAIGLMAVGIVLVLL
jgi:drug/metabolite transporter (DMT)-like permease